MRLLVLAACAAVLALIAQGQASSGPPSISPLIGVYLDFDHIPEGVPVEVMERAVESLLKPAGVTLAWRLTGENLGTESFSGLAVLKFKGRCDVNAPRPPSSFGTLGEVNRLAFTAVSGGSVLPFAEVECDQVRKALSYVAPGTAPLQREQALGLALGRVVAHELYHVLANSAHHAGDGLAKASELLRDLVSPRELSFDESSSNAIRNRFLSER